MLNFINGKKYFFILMALGNVCIASQEWVEKNLQEETHFFDMRDSYHKEMPQDLEQKMNEYLYRTEKLGSLGESFFTNFYEGQDQKLKVPTYNDEANERSGLTNNIPNYLSAPPSREDIIFQDNEQIVSSNGTMDKRTEIADVSSWPFRTTCLLRMMLNSSNPNERDFMGTGFLVGPFHILTAAHNCFDSKKGFAKKISVFPLHYVKKEQRIPSIEEMTKCNPYCAKILKVYLKNNYNTTENINDDMALFVLDKPIGLQVGWSGILSHLQLKSSVSVYGYPKNSLVHFPQGDCECLGRMYSMEGNIVGAYKSVLYHTVDTTGGQSGSGVWREFLESTYAIGVHTGPRIGYKGENRAVMIQNEDVDFISKTIRSHVLKTNILDYLRTGDGGWNQVKVDNFMATISNEPVQDLELFKEQDKKKKDISLLCNYKKYIFYNALFSQKTDDIQDKNIVKNLDLVCARLFLNSIKNLTEADQTYKNLSESILLILMRKKIVGIENQSASLPSASLPFLSSNKTTSFLKELGSIPDSKIKSLNIFPQNKTLDFSVDIINNIIRSELILFSDFNLFSIDNILFHELALLIKTVNSHLGYTNINLRGHQFDLNEADREFFQGKGIEVSMGADS